MRYINQMQNKYTIPSIDVIDEVAKALLNDFPNYKTLAFRGEMGIGKTTFIKALCHQLGVSDTVNSPSFAIVNEYNSPKGETIYHFDFYRIKQPEEAFDMGYEDYFFSGAYCFVEWPEKIESLLPSHRLELHFSEIEHNIRVITIVEFPG